MEKKDSLCDIQKGIANTLNNMSDIDAQITSLKGFYDKINIGWVHVCLSHNGEILYDSSKWKEKRVFFLNDYEMISDANLNEYKLVTATYRTFWFERKTEITETNEKRFYMLCIVILNEIERLKQRKKGKWKDEEPRHIAPLKLTKEQEEVVLKLLNESVFKDKIESVSVSVSVSVSEYLDKVQNYDLSCLYKKKLKRNCCVFLNALTKVLGDEWGERAVKKSTHEDKTLEQIKKYPIPEELKRILSEYKN